MTQIERVARAICNAHFPNGDEGVVDSQWRYFEREAKAAIAAMWTPFDPEDESTWPTEADERPDEPEVLIAMRLSDGSISCDLAFWEDNIWWADNGHSHYRPENITAWMSIVEPTHYQEITQEQDDE